MSERGAERQGVPSGVRLDFPLERFSTLRIGGRADYFARVETDQQARELLAWASAAEIAVAVVGSGSNLLIADTGFRGLVLKLAGNLATIEQREGLLVCGGGARLPAVAAKTARLGLAGLEFGINIPGTVGGSIRMNANAFGGELAAVLDWAEICDAAGLRREPASALGFGYRSSGIAPGQVVTRAAFALKRSTPDEVERGIRAVRALRRERQPLGIRTLGSTFQNPDESVGEGERAAARLLTESGCQELRVAGARFSAQHANFIEIDGSATAVDVLLLLALARRRVHERFGIALEPEVQTLGEVRWPEEWKL